MAERVSQGPVTVLDLHFQTAGTVGAFLVRSPEGPVLVETGPESLFGTLESALNGQGFALEDQVRPLLRDKSRSKSNPVGSMIWVSCGGGGRRTAEERGRRPARYRPSPRRSAGRP